MVKSIRDALKEIMSLRNYACEKLQADVLGASLSD